MQANDTLLLALSKGIWSVDEATATQLQGMADRLLAGEMPALFQAQSAPVDAELKKALHVATFAAAIGSGPRPVRMSWYTDLDKIEPGSLAVIGVQGIMMKASYWGVGSMERAERILEAANHPNIAGIVLDVDTPGGQVDGLGTLNDAILYARQIKPVIGVINDGNAYSAGYHIISACTEVWATHKTCRVGSIGTMCSFTDASEADKKNGYKRVVVYATLSTEKNATYRKALAGDTSGIRAELDILNADFQGRILRTRRAKIKNPAALFNGRTLSATEGVKEGLIDTIGSMQLALARCAELAKVAPPALPADEASDEDLDDDDDEAPTATQTQNPISSTPTMKQFPILPPRNHITLKTRA